MPTIIVDEGDDPAVIARRLLDAAGDRPEQVVTDTRSGGVIAFTVPDDVARAAGYDLDDDQADTTPDDVNPDPGTGDQGAGTGAKAPARNASRDDWAAWLDAQDPPITYDSDAKRDDLVALWDAHNAPAQ